MTKIISQIFVKFRLISEEATSGTPFKKEVVTWSRPLFDDYDTKNGSLSIRTDELCKIKSESE
ncbi:hypothetical protein GHB70_10400 [Enterococcus faecium]|nr:hypothetical protein [Enterococcus faecium]